MDVLHISIMAFILMLTETSNYKKSGHNVKCSCGLLGLEHAKPLVWSFNYIEIKCNILIVNIIYMVTPLDFSCTV